MIRFALRNITHKSASDSIANTSRIIYVMFVALILLVNLPAFAQFAGSAVGSASGSASEAEPEQDPYLEGLRAVSEGRTEDAKAIFAQLVANVPNHAAAWLELAILQCALGNKKEADALFDTIVERFKPAPTIFLEEIAKHRAEGCRGRALQSRFSLTVERGFDSNVNQGASNSIFGFGSGAQRVELPLLPEYLPQKDRFSTVAIDYLRELSPNGTLGILQFRSRQYDALSRFSTTSLALGADTPWQFGRWQGSSGLMLSALTLDQRLYQKQLNFQSRVKVPLNLPKNWQVQLVGGVSRTLYPSLVHYDATTYELKSVLSYQTENHRAQANIGVLQDLADANRIGGDRTGELANLQGRSRISDAVFLDWGWAFQRWQSKKAYSPGLIDQARNQRMQTFRAALSFPFQDKYSLQIEVRHVRNKENISLFEYRGNVIQASWQWQRF